MKRIIPYLLGVVAVLPLWFLLPSAPQGAAADWSLSAADADPVPDVQPTPTPAPKCNCDLGYGGCVCKECKCEICLCEKCPGKVEERKAKARALADAIIAKGKARALAAKILADGKAAPKQAVPYPNWRKTPVYTGQTFTSGPGWYAGPGGLMGGGGQRISGGGC